MGKKKNAVLCIAKIFGPCPLLGAYHISRVVYTRNYTRVSMMAHQLKLHVQPVSHFSVGSLKEPEEEVLTPPEQEPLSSCDGTTCSTNARRGTTTLWYAFGQAKWKRIYTWILEKQDGIDCIYCSHSGREVRSRNSVFITQPFTGNRPEN